MSSSKKKPILTQESELEPELTLTQESELEPVKDNKPKNKYAVGSLVLVSKNADADLNGFKLFPQYKKYTYTVEAYDDEKNVYSLRRLNLLLRLKEADIIAPNEREDSSLVRRQY